MGGMCSSCSDSPSQTKYRGDRLLPENKGKKKRQGETNESDQEDNDNNPTINPTPQSFNLENMGDSLFEDLARFLRTLPPKSKQHIWEHGVKNKTPDGKKVVCDSTQNKDQINRLLCDCVIVYVKVYKYIYIQYILTLNAKMRHIHYMIMIYDNKQYLDRNRAPLSTKKVRPHVEQVALYIHEKYHPLQRDKFENDKTYFAAMLEDYVQV